MIEGDAADLVQHQSAPGPVEERLAEFGLQALQQAAKGRLGQVQGAGGGAEVALTRNRLPLGQLLEVHPTPLPLMRLTHLDVDGLRGC